MLPEVCPQAPTCYMHRDRLFLKIVFKTLKMFKSGGKKKQTKNPSLLLFERWAQDGAVVTPIKCKVWNLTLATETTKLLEHLFLSSNTIGLKKNSYINSCF